MLPAAIVNICTLYGAVAPACAPDLAPATAASVDAWPGMAVMYVLPFSSYLIWPPCGLGATKVGLPPLTITVPGRAAIGFINCNAASPTFANAGLYAPAINHGMTLS